MPVTYVSVAQFLADEVGGSTGEFTIEDTAWNIATNIAGLDAYSAGIAGIEISDTGADVFSFISQLEPLAVSGKLTAINLTDTATYPYLMTTSDFSGSSAALALINGTYRLWIVDAPAADVATIAANTHVEFINVTDTAANVAANIASLETVAADGQLFSLRVTDTAANVVANIASLEILAVGGQLNSITLSDSSTPTISLTGAQVNADSAALGKIGTNYNLSISGSISVAAAIAVSS